VKTPDQLAIAFESRTAEPIPIPRRIFSRTNSRNFLRAVVALILWAVLICVVSIVYEIWRLETNWRLRIPA